MLCPVGGPASLKKKLIRITEYVLYLVPIISLAASPPFLAEKPP